jgi:outer membrane receptor protein involved in Fe transport
MRSLKLLSCTIVSATMPFAVLTLSAQTATPPVVPPPPEPVAPALSDDIIRLDPFRVTADTDQGYIAVDSLAGGRTNTPVKLTPSSMSSLTRAFFDDASVQNVRDALKWTLNVVPSDWTAGKRTPFNSWDFNFRGAGQALQGGSGPTRNYFTFYQVADTYNLDRIEFDRGPNSILFGIGTVGGVLTAYTKVPRQDKDFMTPTVTVDNFGSYRFELDLNRRISEKLSMRFNALEDHRQGWRDNDFDSQRAFDLALLYNLTDRTTFRIEGEISKAKRTILPDSYGESVSYWDGTSSSPTWGAPTDDVGTARMHPWGAPIYNLYVAGQPDLGLQDWSGGYRSDGSYLRVAPDDRWYEGIISNPNRTLDTAKIPVLPSREFTFSPGDALSRPEYKNLTAWLTHSFNDNLDLAITGYRFYDDHSAKNYEAPAGYAIDLNQQLPNGAANPNFGKAYGDFFLSQQTQKRSVTEGRVQLNYHFEAEPFGVPLKQLFSVSTGSQRITWGARQYNAQLVDPNITDVNSRMVWTRLYLDQPNAGIHLPDTFDGKTIEYAPMPFDWFDFDETYKLKNVSAFSHSRLWGDKLSVLVGARYDDYDHYRRGANSGDEISDGANGNTYSAGAVYYFGWLGIFGNFSKNFDPVGPGKNPGLDGNPFGAATGEGWDYGFRIATEDNRYYATISRYESRSMNRITTSKIGFGNLWNLHSLATGTPADPALTNLSYDDTEDLKVSGYEFELTANPTRNLRLQASFSLPESEIVNALPGQRAYYAANFATWEAAANAATPEGENLRNALVNAQRTLDQNTAGKDKTGLVKYTASLFANYTFRDGSLNGFSVGGGVSQIGKQYLGEIRGEKFYSSERLTTQLVVAYETKFRDLPARIALNVDNILNDRDPIYTGYDSSWLTPGGRPVISGYYFPNPLTLRLSMRLTF